jgi:hypothetical protein
VDVRVNNFDELLNGCRLPVSRVEQLRLQPSKEALTSRIIWRTPFALRDIQQGFSSALILVCAASSFAGEPVFTHQTRPGSSTRDYGEPAWVTKEGVTYQTKPGSSTRDWTAPTFITKKQ